MVLTGLVVVWGLMIGLVAGIDGKTVELALFSSLNHYINPCHWRNRHYRQQHYYHYRHHHRQYQHPQQH